MVSVGTKAALTKVNGNIIMNPAHCAASTLLTRRPMIADIQELAIYIWLGSPNIGKGLRILYETNYSWKDTSAYIKSLLPNVPRAEFELSNPKVTLMDHV